MASWLAVLIHQLRMGDVVLALALFLLTTCLLYYILRLCRIAGPTRFAERYVGLAWQLGALLSLEQVYELARGRIIHQSQTTLAFLNAYRLLDLEWRHGFFVESRLERFFLQSHLVMNAVDLFYVIGHLLGTIGVLAWVYVRRRSCYPFMRNMLIVTTGLALIAFYVYPTAPPRLLYNYGFVDPLQLHHLIPAGGAQPDSYTYDPYAAMPSLHVVYALVVACVLWIASRQLITRTLAVLYPCAMAAAVVISGNHWVLDVAGALMTVVLAGGLLLALSWVQAAVQSFSLPASVLLFRRLRFFTVD